MPKASKSRRRRQGQNRPTNQEQQAAARSTTEEAQQRRRIQEMSPRARTISLIIGDILCFLIFASLGTDTHGKGVNPLNSLWVAAPFMVAWFLVSPFIGAFRADIATFPTKMLRRTVYCWLLAWPGAMFLRWLQGLLTAVLAPALSPVLGWIPVERIDQPASLAAFVSFSLVALIANLILLIIWRWPFALNNSLRKRGV